MKGLISENIIIKSSREYKHIKEYCPKCQGAGKIYSHIHDGKCFDCNGTGILEYDDKILTPEEVAQQVINDNRRIERECQQQVEVNNANLKEKYFKSNNTLYLIDIEKTYKIKSQLKKDGAIFLPEWGIWAMKDNNKKDKYPLVKVEYKNIIIIDTQEEHSIREDIEQYLNSLSREV